MKKTIILTACAAFLMACNSETKKESGTGHSAHKGHTSTDSSNKEDNDTQAMHAAMQKMMDAMHTSNPTGDPDYDFAAMMKIHHEGAVEMAKVVVKKGKDTAVVAHATNTIREQEGEIQFFDQFLSSRKIKGNSEYGKNAAQMMSHMDGNQSYGSLEQAYAAMMIPHHEDGVKMAEAYLKEGKEPGLRKIAQSIMQTQPKEIAEYRQWLGKED